MIWLGIIQSDMKICHCLLSEILKYLDCFTLSKLYYVICQFEFVYFPKLYLYNFLGLDSFVL